MNKETPTFQKENITHKCDVCKQSINEVNANAGTIVHREITDHFRGSFLYICDDVCFIVYAETFIKMKGGISHK